MKTSTAAVVAAVTLGLFAILAWLSTQHVDISTYFYMVPAVLPAIAALFGVSQVQKGTDTIKTNTNGTLTKAALEKSASDSALMLALAHLSPEEGIAVLNARTAALTVGTVPAPVLVPTAPAVAPTPVTAPPAPAPEPTVPTDPALPTEPPASA